MTLIDKIFELEENPEPRLASREMTAFDRNRAADTLGAVVGKLFPADVFPETGIVVEQDGIPVCYLPVYLEQSSKVAVLGHFVGVPGIDKFLLHRAAEMALSSAVKFAQKSGRPYIISIFAHPAVNRIADRNGFRTAEVIEEKLYHLK